MDLEVLKLLLQQKLSDKDLILEKLHGDASARTYYRARAGGKSWVVMQMPAGPASISEEITNLPKSPQELPFLNIQRFLKKEGLPVPEVLSWDEKSRLMLLEDCGDETLARRVAVCSPKEKEGWYKKAIDLLITFQRCRPDPACLAFQRSFDARLLDWEFDHFIEYGIEARQSTPLPPGEKETLRQELHRITAALLQLPQTLTHRDFQSRNLMIQGERLRLLDFQDALKGPLPYDLVALLRDSYIVLEWPLVERLIDYYLPKKGEAATRPFKNIFDWMTIQRKLKDAGRFVSIDRVKKNASFLPYLPTSLKYVREAFERQKELYPLFERLKKYVPEFL